MSRVLQRRCAVCAGPLVTSQLDEDPVRCPPCIARRRRNRRVGYYVVALEWDRFHLDWLLPRCLQIMEEADAEIMRLRGTKT